VVLTTQDYYPFGMAMTERGYQNVDRNEQRYGFNGKENDEEWGKTVQDYGWRISSPASGKFLSVDPLRMKFPMLTPYQFASNTPIMAIDLDGLEATIVVQVEAEASFKVGLGIKNSVAIGVAVDLFGSVAIYNTTVGPLLDKKMDKSYPSSVFPSHTIDQTGNVFNTLFDALATIAEHNGGSVSIDFALGAGARVGGLNYYGVDEMSGTGYSLYGSLGFISSLGGSLEYNSDKQLKGATIAYGGGLGEMSFGISKGNTSMIVFDMKTELPQVIETIKIAREKYNTDKQVPVVEAEPIPTRPGEFKIVVNVYGVATPTLLATPNQPLPTIKLATYDTGLRGTYHNDGKGENTDVIATKAGSDNLIEAKTAKAKK
jgi:RHS repeat-associated protein